MPGHPSILDQPRNIADVDLAPDALLAPRRVTLQIILLVKAFDYSIDPAPAEHDVDLLILGDRLEAGIHLVDLDPNLVGLVVVLAEPFVEARRVLEFADLRRIDLDGRHRLTCRRRGSRSRPRWRSGSHRRRFRPEFRGRPRPPSRSRCRRAAPSRPPTCPRLPGSARRSLHRRTCRAASCRTGARSRGSNGGSRPTPRALPPWWRRARARRRPCPSR